MSLTDVFLSEYQFFLICACEQGMFVKNRVLSDILLRTSTRAINLKKYVGILNDGSCYGYLV